jgi:predicted metalloprotease with PDZ domain
MPQYHIDIGDLHGHRFAVTIKITHPQHPQRVSLPVWIPGSYLVREFARHLSPISARQGQRSCAVTPVDKCSWDIDTAGKEALTISYEVYAFDTSVRAAFLDARRGFFNGTSVFLAVQGQEDAPHDVKIGGLPRGWQVATALTPRKVQASGAGDYRAASYDELVDHPVELGRFWRGHFTVRGARHELVVSGAPDDLDGQKLLDDTRRICEAQIAFWHGPRKPPFSHYVFLLNVIDDGYGGLEHRQSTALICGRKDVPRKDRPANAEAYTTLLGLISHEYFHTWNVKRLKPTAFAPYDYTRENHTRMLWFFEGFTSYYDDQFLLRAGLITPDAYLKLLTKTVNQVLATPGRLRYSVAQASFDAWTRYYRPDENTANATVSYYTKGSLVGLALDLALRQLPPQEGQQPSLDSVMKVLWQLGHPIEAADVAKALAAVAGQPPACRPARKGASAEQAWAALLHDWTEGCDDLPLAELLRSIGVSWQTKAAPVPQQLGCRLQDQAGGVKVQAVMRDSVAEHAGLSAGDELIALDDWRLKRAEDLTTWYSATRDQTLLVSRDQRLMPLTLPAQSASGTGTSPGRKKAVLAASSARPAELTVLSLADLAADAATAARRQAWLPK